MPKLIKKLQLQQQLPKLKRVAAYARVSTGKDAMLHSLASQVSYYNDLIQNHDGWLFAGIFADEAATGTKNNRLEFQRMLEKCRNGEIDLIITKSISRFARNTVTLLETVRELKNLGVDVFFEEQNIHTASSDGELMLTILASYAQEESRSASRSISENVTWGHRKRFADGKFSVGYSHFLGYEKGENGAFKINEEQAVTVRMIYKLFLEGKTTQGICKFLMSKNIPSPAGKKQWNTSTVMSILQNEKYKGDALLQKHFTVDFLTKELRKNNGEVQQYYVQGSHEPIIEPEEFDLVQDEIIRRKKLGRAYSDKAFHSKLICADCGSFYGRKVWHSNNQYRQVIFQCNNKFKKTERCKTPKFKREEIIDKFLKALNILLSDRTSLITDCELIYETLCNTSEIDKQIAKVSMSIQLAADMMKSHVKKNASVIQSQADYEIEAKQIEEMYMSAVTEFEKLNEKKAELNRKSKEIRAFISDIKKQPLAISEWDERLWITLLDTATVNRDGSIDFLFKNGQKITC